MNSPHLITNESFNPKHSRGITLFLYSVGLIVLVCCLFYLLNRVYVIEKKLVPLSDIARMNYSKISGDDLKKIDLLENKFASSINESQKFSSVVLAVMGLLFSIATALLIPVAAYFYSKSSHLYSQSSKVYQQSSDTLKEVEEIQNKIDSQMEINATIQKELSRANTVQYTNIEKSLEDIISDELRNSLSLFLTTIQHADSYRWCVVNSFSMDRNLRHRALQNIIAHQDVIFGAKDYIISLLNHFQGPEFEDDRNIILLGLGIK